eukprot:4709037-Amphidinium_carterae.1
MTRNHPVGGGASTSGLPGNVQNQTHRFHLFIAITINNGKRKVLNERRIVLDSTNKTNEKHDNEFRAVMDELMTGNCAGNRRSQKNHDD